MKHDLVVGVFLLEFMYFAVCARVNVFLYVCMDGMNDKSIVVDVSTCGTHWFVLC